MGYKIWILTTFLIGTFAPVLLKPADELDSNDYTVSLRIHGGTPAGSVPYMVALTCEVPERGFFCGGSLVTTRTILTAAHCVVFATSKEERRRSLLATVGTNRWNVPGESYEIANTVIHPKYANLTNDVGLLITTVEVRLSNKVRTVPLHYGFIGPNVVARVTGWGKTETERTPSELQQLAVKTIEGKRCVDEVAEIVKKQNWQVRLVEPEIELCTFHSLHHGTCNGDSGSPLVLADGESQIGIVSWGLPCAIGAPDMFVRISAFKDWLQQNIV